MLFLQNLMGVPLGFDFILYKHGPFSFDLRDELTSLRADELLQLEPQWPYGPRFAPTERSDYIQRNCSKTLAKYDDCITFVARKFGGKGVAELERLATALFITQGTNGDASVDERAMRLTTLKPHIPLDSAARAIEEVDHIIGERPDL
jgi:hypothetical protein